MSQRNISDLISVTFNMSQFDLYYYRTRYYNSSVGRFISKDIYQGNIWNPPSLNRYVYVVNNPVNWVDPWGLWPPHNAESVNEYLDKCKERGTTPNPHVPITPEELEEAMQALADFIVDTFGDILIPDEIQNPGFPYDPSLLDLIKEWLGDWFVDQTFPDYKECK